MRNIFEKDTDEVLRKLADVLEKIRNKNKRNKNAQPIFCSIQK